MPLDEFRFEFVVRLKFQIVITVSARHKLTKRKIDNQLVVGVQPLERGYDLIL